MHIPRVLLASVAIAAAALSLAPSATANPPVRRFTIAHTATHRPLSTRCGDRNPTPSNPHRTILRICLRRTYSATWEHHWSPVLPILNDSDIHYWDVETLQCLQRLGVNHWHAVRCASLSAHFYIHGGGSTYDRGTFTCGYFVGRECPASFHSSRYRFGGSDHADSIMTITQGDPICEDPTYAYVNSVRFNGWTVRGFITSPSMQGCIRV